MTRTSSGALPKPCASPIESVRNQALFALVQSESDAALRYLDRLLTGH